MINMVLLTILSASRPVETFLLIPPTAKASAMGYAQTAYCLDASANYFNSAFMPLLNRMGIILNGFKYLPNWIADIYYAYIAGVIPRGKSALGIDFTYMSMGMVDVRDFEGNYLGEYLCYKDEGKISFAHIVWPGFAAGLGIKVISQNYQYGWGSDWPVWLPLGLESTGRGTWLDFNIDLAYQINPRFCLAMVIHDFGPNIKYQESVREGSLPTTWRLAMSYAPIKNPNLSMALSGEITKLVQYLFAGNNTFWDQVGSEIKSAWKSVGIEIGLWDTVFLRSGYFYDYEGSRKGFTYGGGIKLFKFEFDLGVDENVYDFHTSQKKFSLSYTF